MIEARTDNERVVLHFLATLSTGDLEAVRPLFHENASWTPMVRGVPGEGKHVGRSTIIDGFLAPVRGYSRADPSALTSKLLNERKCIM